MQDDVYQAMFEIEDRHWWYVAKQQIVLNLLSRYLPRNNGVKPRVADLGCGCGAMLKQLSTDYDAVGFDGSPHAIEFCRQRGVQAEIAKFPEGPQLPPGSFDAVLLLDVLEHLEDDVTAMKNSAALLRPGGIMICTVPAYQRLWTYWDKLHHHFRRYSRTRLGKLLDQPELKIELLSYANTVLFPLAASIRLVQKWNEPTNPKADMNVPMAPVNWAFRMIYASERHLLGRVPLPFGLSVVAVARKQNVLT